MMHEGGNATRIIGLMDGDSQTMPGGVTMQLKKNAAVTIMLAALTLSTIAMIWTGQPENPPVAKSPPVTQVPG
jgi:hypothetical protein